MTDIDAILRLRRVATALLAGELPPAADAIEHGAALACFLDRTCPTLEHALNLPAVGHPLRDRLAERDELVADAIARHFDGHAGEFAVALARYRANGWHRDRLRASSPGNETQAALWNVLRCRDTVIGRRRAEQIVAKFRP